MQARARGVQSVRGSVFSSISTSERSEAFSDSAPGVSATEVQALTEARLHLDEAREMQIKGRVSRPPRVEVTWEVRTTGSPFDRLGVNALERRSTR